MIRLRNPNSNYLAIAVIAILSDSPVCADDFEHRFGTATPGEPAFIVGFDSQAKWIDLAENRLRIRWDAKQGEMPWWSVKSIFALRDDFTVELQYSVRRLGKPEKGFGCGVQLNFAFADPEQSGLLVSHVREVDGRELIVVDETRDDSQVHEVTRCELQKGLKGLRVARSADQLTVSAVTLAGPAILVNLPVSTADVFPVGVGVFTGGASCDVDLTLYRLKVSGGAIPLGNQIPATPASAWIWLRRLNIALLLVVAAWSILKTVAAKRQQE